MQIFDIIIALLLVFALYKGFKQGMVMQLAGLCGILLGVFLAFKFATQVSEWLELSADYGMVISFVCILIAVLVLLSLLGRVFKGIFNFVGLGVVDKILGSLLSVLKTCLILGALVSAFEVLNGSWDLVDDKTLNESFLYKPLLKVSDVIFYYLDFVKDSISEMEIPDIKLPEQIKI